MSQVLDIDARRLLCPMPVIRLQNGLSNLKPGERAKIVCTDPGVLNDIPTWCRINGHQVISSIECDDEFVFVVEKSEEN